MSAIIEALAAEPGCEMVRAGTLDDFLARNPRALVFMTGDIVQRPEGLDVAVVVRQMLAKYAGRLAVGLLDRRDEGAVMPRLGVVVLPAVAYVRDGTTAEIVARMRDWPVYTQACERLLAPEGAPTNPVGGNA